MIGRVFPLSALVSTFWNTKNGISLIWKPILWKVNFLSAYIFAFSAFALADLPVLSEVKQMFIALGVLLIYNSNSDIK